MEALPKPEESAYWLGMGANLWFDKKTYQRDLAEWNDYEKNRQGYLGTQAQLEKDAAAFAAERDAFKAQLAVMEAQRLAQQKQTARDQRRRNPNKPAAAEAKGGGMVSTNPDAFGGATMLTAAPQAAPTALALIAANFLGG